MLNVECLVIDSANIQLLTLNIQNFNNGFSRNY
jgi:hypothetical protein